MNPKYKKMVAMMQEKAAGRKVASGKWFLYILRCKDGSFYTGITNDLQRRLKMHNEGRASRYTRSRRPVKLVYQEVCNNRAQALARECAVKTFSRKKKEELIADLSQDLSHPSLYYF